jgi:cytochrome c-type biogenesis protein CcmE
VIRRRWAAIGVLVVVVAGIAVLGARFADDGLVYYRTPSEVAEAGPWGSPIRVSGLVLIGTLERTEPESSLVLSDGDTDLTVRYAGRLPATIHEGEGAVVEGRLADDGVFWAEEVLLQHSNEYGPNDREYGPEAGG